MRLQEAARKKEVNDLGHRISVGRPPLPPPLPRRAAPRGRDTNAPCDRKFFGSVGGVGVRPPSAFARPFSAHRPLTSGVTRTRGSPNEFHGTNPGEMTCPEEREDDSDVGVAPLSDHGGCRSHVTLEQYAEICEADP